MPDWAQEGGAKATLARFENEDELSKIKRSLQQKSPLVYKRVVLMSKDQKLAQITGKSVAQIAEEWGVPVEDAVITIFKMDIGVSCVNFSMSEEDVINFMKQPWVMTGSDGGGLHPRTYATFTQNHYRLRTAEKGNVDELGNTPSHRFNRRNFWHQR